MDKMREAVTRFHDREQRRYELGQWIKRFIWWGVLGLILAMAFLYLLRFPR